MLLQVGFTTGQAWVMPLANLAVHLEVLCGDMVRGAISSLSMTDFRIPRDKSAVEGGRKACQTPCGSKPVRATHLE